MNIKERLVRYNELIPCTTAFIDTRSPGSDKKENFTIIGPGVAENPEQHVHISIPHGFNIGGARQPAGCLNSQHSHLTEEVFLVHTGVWDFISGVNANDGRVTLYSGDVISIPTNVFRGFECLSGLPNGPHEGLGYLHAILGQDDPGRVLWAPAVFDLAKEHGLVLLENGSLLDTANGNNVSPEDKIMPVTTDEQIAEHIIVDSEGLKNIVLRTNEFNWQCDTPLSQFKGVFEAGLVGEGSLDENIHASKLSWKHGFVFRALKLAPQALIQEHIRYEEEVIFVQKGELHVKVNEEELVLRQGDNFSTPIMATRVFSNLKDEECIVYITRRGNQPKAPSFI